MARSKLPALPELLKRKIYKTGQTRGADDDVIYQNRVGRWSTVLIPYASWEVCATPHDGTGTYENGFIVLISPADYFGKPSCTIEIAKKGLKLGENALIFYEKRDDWETYNPVKLGWKPASNRTNPLGGNYVARIAATTALEDAGKIIRGFDATARKGAGIRVYEYASIETTKKCCIQLEALFWLCVDAKNVAVKNGMTVEGAEIRAAAYFKLCEAEGLLERDRLVKARILDKAENTVCPLCLEKLSAEGFFNRLEQAPGRIVHDLTVTQLNLFHIQELKYDGHNHRPYNLGWGHHHCNVVVKDSGIPETLNWMRRVVLRNEKAGY